MKKMYHTVKGGTDIDRSVEQVELAEIHADGGNAFLPSAADRAAMNHCEADETDALDSIEALDAELAEIEAELKR